MGAPVGHAPYPGAETGGRPPRWSDAKELSEKVEKYFHQYEKAQEGDIKYKKAPSLWGLCRYTKMSYDCFRDYESGKMDTETEKFSESLVDARMRCLEFAGDHMYLHTAGAMATATNLTRNFPEPWKNAQSNEVTGANGGSLEISILSDRIKEARERSNGN